MYRANRFNFIFIMVINFWKLETIPGCEMILVYAFIGDINQEESQILEESLIAASNIQLQHCIVLKERLWVKLA